MGTGESTNRSAVREQIIDAVEVSVRSGYSSLSDDELAATQFKQQMRDILDDVILRADSATGISTLSHQYAVETARTSTAIGRSRARQQIHPADSLEAANILFDLALPVLTQRMELEASTLPAPLVIARALHQSIMARVAPASIGYVDVLLEKLSIAHLEERMRVSHELHDRVAHGIAAGIQRISLSISAGSRYPEEREELLATATDILSDTLADTRQIAFELRQSVGEKMLDDAVRDYLNDSVYAGPVWHVRSEGIRRALPTSASEESFLIIREALRNSVAHSHGTVIDVSFAWTDDELTVEVSDDGDGFDSSTIRHGAMGLLTMRERADVIGAELTISSRMGFGTSVALEIDLGDSRN